ncbi:ExsB family protein [Candidatus Pacearchaeota archaeon]|nr:ExsB family protein [Candidatus Pacearchaeota archaeon]|tara:strand:- start:1276 stop:2313 length:1038 start_codon:yes stop_codon:yes gene_type:complete
MICNRCVLDTVEVPDIYFDYEGICNYCRKFEKDEFDRTVEKNNLQWVYHNLRKRKGKYQCLLGLSGGVDSSMCLRYLIENGIKPLTYSIDNGWNTEASDENIMRLVEGMKVPFFRYTIDIDKFKNLQDAFIQSGTKNLEIPTDHILMASTYEMALKHGIKDIISGGNLATEGILPKSYGYQARDLKHLKAVYKQFKGEKLTGLPMISLPKYLYSRFVKGIRITNLLDYYEYDRGEAIKLLEEKYGYTDYGLKHEESNFTKWFQNFYLPAKFNLDKRKPHFSSLINSGQMKREDALKQLAQFPTFDSMGNEEKVLKYTKRDYKEYPNNEKLWDFLSKVYANLVKRK